MTSVVSWRINIGPGPLLRSSRSTTGSECTIMTYLRKTSVSSLVPAAHQALEMEWSENYQCEHNKAGCLMLIDLNKCDESFGASHKNKKVVKWAILLEMFSVYMCIWRPINRYSPVVPAWEGNHPEYPVKCLPHPAISSPSYPQALVCRFEKCYIASRGLGFTLSCFYKGKLGNFQTSWFERNIKHFVRFEACLGIVFNS